MAGSIHVSTNCCDQEQNSLSFLLSLVCIQEDLPKMSLSLCQLGAEWDGCQAGNQAV